jgi:DNA-binding MarR family transcriptional regulator
MARHPASAAAPETARFYQPVGYCADESVGWLMKRALMSVAQAADRRLEPKGITHAQWAALFMLQSRRAATVAELARETQRDPGATTRLLDRLEAKGFCRRERSTDDRRVVRVELTPEGEIAAQEVPVVLAQVLNEHLAGFSRAEWSQLKDMLKRMVANGEAAETRTPS